MKLLLPNVDYAEIERRALAYEEDQKRTLRELQRVRPGDSLTRFDPPLAWNVIFEAARSDDICLVGYELHSTEGERLLVGHVNQNGSIGTVFSSDRQIVAARKAWL